MITLNPEEISLKNLQRTLQFAIGPRPIALVSSVNSEGDVNLSPFSFYNIFSSNPPILIFSPARRGRDGSTKNTLDNVLSVPEVVIHSVSAEMVHQTSLSSTEYDSGINEFIKAGFESIASDIVQPPRIKSAPIAMECHVKEVRALGDGPGAGNLVICEIHKIHIQEKVLDENGKLDQDKLNLVGRLGGDWYVNASGEALFEVEKPVKNKGIGVDAIPKSIRNSTVLTGNNLGQLGNIQILPQEADVIAFLNHHRIESIFNETSDAFERRELIHLYAKELLELGKVEKAWKALLIDGLNAIKEKKD
jgi:flavin reductase (DIM6/NTAB) family NADH-FMN oxidoreductase RutF